MNATRNVFKNGVRHLTFSKWLEDVDFDIFLDGGSIKISNKEVSISQLKDIIKKNFHDDIVEELEYLQHSGIKLKEFCNKLDIKNIDEYFKK